MKAICGGCGQQIRLVAWGGHHKWVTGRKSRATWHCLATAQAPTRAHYPVTHPNPYPVTR